VGGGLARAADLAHEAVGAVVRYAADPLRGYAPVTASVAAVGRTLLLVDTPEAVRGPGLLYRDRVAGPFRVFLYALDAARRPLAFGVYATDPGPQPALLEVSRIGVGGPSSDYYGVGTLALEHYFLPRPLRLVRVEPGATVDLLPDLAGRPAHPGQLVNAIVDAAAVSAPVWVSVVAERRASADLHGLDLLPPGPGPLMRGTFPNGDFSVAARFGPGPGYVLVGAYPRYLHGFSAVDHRPTVDYGNYGVLYDLRLEASGAEEGLRTVLFLGRGLGYAGLGLLAGPGGGRPVGLFRGLASPLTPRDAVVLAHLPVRPGRLTRLHLQWMPAGASTLPAAFAVAE
jgi:hypothetical protein